jgi:Family of unknown function (DUF5357)
VKTFFDWLLGLFFIKQLSGLWDQFVKFLKARVEKIKQGFSWETLILLSLLSWLVAFTASNEFLKEFIGRMGWLFLTIAVGWSLEKVEWKPLGFSFLPGPWVTGALLCLFVFREIDLNDDFDITNNFPTRLTVWPLVSAAFTFFPKILKYKFDLINPAYFSDPTKKDDERKDIRSTRQEMVVLGLFSALLSCWIQFHFTTQTWLDQYPSLQSEDFGRSSTTVRILPGNAAASRGVVLLETTETALQETLLLQSWPQVQRWLANIDEEVPVLEARALEIMSNNPAPEDQLWTLRGQVLQGEPEYTVRFRAFWGGPSSREGGFFLERRCLIAETSNVGITGVDGSPVPLTDAGSIRIECQPVSDKIWLQQDQEESPP